MSLWITDSGASTQEIERGISAAQVVFEKAGVRPFHAYAATLAKADDLPHDPALVELFETAETAAFQAAFAGWKSWPEGAQLVCEA